MSLKTKVKFLTSYLMTEKFLLFLGILVSGTSIILSIYSPKIIAEVINTDISKIDDIYKFLTYYGILYFSVITLTSFTEIIYKFIFSRMSTRLGYKIQLDLVSKMQNFEMKYFDNSFAGDLVSRFTSDTSIIRNLYQITFTEIFRIVFTVISVLVVLFSINFYLFLIVVIYLPVIYFISKYYGKKVQEYSHTVKEHSGIQSSIYNETIKSLPMVQIYSNERDLIDNFEKESSFIRKAQTNWAIMDSLFTFNITKLIRGVTASIVIFLFAYFKLNNYAINIGFLYLILEYNGKILQLFMHFLFNVRAYKSAFVSCERILKILETPFEINSSVKKEISGNLEFKNVYFEYKDNLPVLRDISFELENGKSLAFIGETGSGKSTIMNLILGFYENQGGQILFDGADFKTMDKKFIRNQMSVVLQEPYIFSGTIFDNITLGDEKFSEKDALNAIEKVGGKYIIEKREKGLYSELISNGSELSLGEKQIICFARAIIREPKILILDEATANIDTETEKIISYGLDVLMKDRTTIIIAHRLSTIKHCDNIVMIEKGYVVESGTHSELINLNGKYKTWYDIQSSKGEI